MAAPCVLHHWLALAMSSMSSFNQLSLLKNHVFAEGWPAKFAEGSINALALALGSSPALDPNSWDAQLLKARRLIFLVNGVEMYNVNV